MGGGKGRCSCKKEHISMGAPSYSLQVFSTLRQRRRKEECCFHSFHLLVLFWSAIRAGSLGLLIV